MKKDIDTQIPEVEHVYVVAAFEHNVAFKVDEWTIYLVNANSKALETVLVVSKGESQTKTTSVLRKKLEVLPAKSFAKLEFLHEDVLEVDNIFQVTYFLNGKLMHKDFEFPKHSLKPKAVGALPLLSSKGIIAQ
ncbi:hypothetical protein G3567_01420 [Psychroflexus sp. YR1-1]|uniref:Phenylalanyl-tRNA synthetase subunit alpha n=1 Tax=Psychroflexus aurantiacus TaxID=2709310 RepID=A0A6B3R5V7_9FLAO|nr:hypothetical protein [Psychroflexus aurantiacus]NEV92804.1 hypothetical protein [Psychroflexus aurantiacus]